MSFNNILLDKLYKSVSKHKFLFDKAQGLTTIIEVKIICKHKRSN